MYRQTFISRSIAVVGGLFTDVNGPGGDFGISVVVEPSVVEERQKNHQCVGALFEISVYLFLSRVSNDDTQHLRRMT